MAVLLVLAVVGGVVRALAPDPSTARDLGTVMLLLWLPAIGNLICYLMKKLPKAAPPPTHFAPGAAFSAHLEARLWPLATAASVADALPPDQLATLLVGRQGFTVRFATPLSESLAHQGESIQALELLRPAAAAGRLRADVDFHLLVELQPVAKGRVVRCVHPLLG